MDATRAQLGDEVFDALRIAGRGITIDQAIDKALLMEDLGCRSNDASCGPFHHRKDYSDNDRRRIGEDLRAQSPVRSNAVLRSLSCQRMQTCS